jgi:hypothetical protein
MDFGGGDAEPRMSAPLLPGMSEARLQAAPQPTRTRPKPGNFFCLGALAMGGILTLGWIALLSWLVAKVALMFFF